MTPETARLLQHWRHHEFSGVRPFFCQVEAVETVIWLTEVAPNRARRGKGFLDHLAAAPTSEANPELLRLALKLATGAGKTTVMAMLIAWQTVNAVRRPEQQALHPRLPGRHAGHHHQDRLRVLQPNDPDSYYASRELVPADMLRGHRTREDRHHELPRLQAARADGAVEGRRARCSRAGAATSSRRSKPKARCSSGSCPS